jgi:hypothetical protein
VVSAIMLVIFYSLESAFFSHGRVRGMYLSSIASVCGHALRALG